MTQDVAPGLRVSDPERDAAAHQLREHFAVGRLNVDELHDRLDRVYTARTRAELDAALTDLPSVAAEVVPAPSPRRRHAWGKFVRVNAICWSIWGVTVATSSPHHLAGLWPLWVTVPWGAAMLSSRRRSC